MAPRYEHLNAREETVITLNLARIAGFIVKEVASKRSMGECMDRVIARCSKGRPHEDWERLRALPYDNLNPMRRWITKPFRVEPSPVKLAGLWFGIFNPYYNDKPVADIYVCGATRFEANDREWAVRPKWWPDGRYAHSSILARIYKIAYRKGGLGNDAEYPLCLAYGSLMVRDLLREIEPSVFLNSSMSLGVAVGFDDGDYVVLGELNKRGLVALSG